LINPARVMIMWSYCKVECSLSVTRSRHILNARKWKHSERANTGVSKGTIFVSANDKNAYHFQSIQSAINSLDDLSPIFILIGAGFYHEVINITRKAPLTILGQTNNPQNCGENLCLFLTLLQSTQISVHLMMRIPPFLLCVDWKWSHRSTFSNCFR